MTQSVAGEITQFLSSLRPEDLPADVVDKAKICVLDAMGMALEGYRLEPVARAMDVAAELHPHGGDTTLLGRGGQIGVLDAVFANCVAIHALLHDDTLQDCHSHPAGPVVSAALAVAEHSGADGARTLLGVVNGYEMMARLGDKGKTGWGNHKRGFRNNSTYGVFGAAAAAATILGLDAEKYRNAVTCAASFACGLLEPLYVGSMEWRHATGVAARNGVLAALLAKRGLRAAPTAIEGKFGFWRAFSGVTEIPASATADFGSFYSITNTFHKPFPTASEFTWNSTMYVLQQLVKERRIDHREVESIEVTVLDKMLDYPGLKFAGPYETLDQAIASKPFALAAIVRNAGFTAEVYRTQLHDPAFYALAQKVKINGADWEGQWRCHIVLTLKDGRTIEGDERLSDRSIFYPDREGEAGRFRAMAAGVVPDSRAEAIVAEVYALDGAPNVRGLTSLMVVSKS